MNKNTKSTSRTKKAPAKVTKSKTTKSTAMKTQATKTPAKVAKGKTTKSAATKPQATKTQTTRVKESPQPEELPHDKSPDPLDNESSDNESYDKLPNLSGRSSGLSTNNILDIAAMLMCEAQLEKLRQYYYANKEAICKDQNSKYPARREREKNNPELLAKQRQVCKKYYHQNKDKILPKVKKLPRKRVLRCALIVERQKSWQLNTASKVGALSKSINLLRSRPNYWFLHHFFMILI